MPMYNVSYMSSGGVEINLSAPPYLWVETDLLDYLWEYELIKSSSGFGSSLRNISRTGRTFKMMLTVYNDNLSSIATVVGYLSEIFEADVLAKTPGKLIVNGSYVKGYFIGSTKSFKASKLCAQVELAFVTWSPFWITEELHTFEPLSTGSTDGFIFPLGFPYGFVSPDVRTLINDHYGPCMAKISFYGPCTDPEINLGPNTYKVFGELLPGERFEIDQVAMTVTKITAGGERLNFLYARNKTKSVFDRIPAGESFVTATDFTFDILLYKERSEPKWS